MNKKNFDTPIFSDKNHFFSIIIPVYNAERFLHACLESILNQRFKSFEIICVNDGSKDKSLEILKQYALRDIRVRVFSQENLGPAAARNLGLQNSTGKFVWFVDADDTITDNALEEAYNILECSNIDILLFGSQVYDLKYNKIINDNIRSLSKIPLFLLNKIININDFANIFDLIPTEAWNKIFNRNFIINNNIKFNVKLYGMDDGFFTQESIIRSNYIYITNKILYIYKVSNPKSIVSYLLDVSLKNYKITIDYSNETINLLQKVNVGDKIIFSLVKKNVSRCLYYYSRTRGLVRILYRKELVNNLKIIKQLYPFCFTDDSDAIFAKAHTLLKYNFLTTKKLKNFLYKRKEKIYFDNFYKIKKYKYYILGLLVFKRKIKMLDLSLFGNSLIQKFQRSINAALLHQQTFSEFKNCNENKSVVLMGAGPSVKFYTPIKNAIHVGCGRAVLFDKVHFDYLFTIDKISLDAIGETFLNYKNANCIKFIGDINWGKDYQISEKFRLLCHARAYKTTCKISPSRFVLDIDKEPLGAFHSVVFQAAQFVMFTNPKIVYLVGMDCSAGGKHFAGKEHDVSSRGEDILYLQQEQVREWKLFKDFVNLYYPETKIISVNPIGLKNMFSDCYTREFLDENKEMNLGYVSILEN